MNKQNKTQLEKCFDTWKRIVWSVNSKEISVLTKVLSSQEKKLTEEELQIYLQRKKEYIDKYWKEL